MLLNYFSVRIPEGREIPGGYVEMEHGAQYALVLRNNGSARCDARVEIDGKHVGTWRIDTCRSVALERPAHDTGRFTFYRLGSPEAVKVGLTDGDPNLGLVKVTFTPERIVRPVYTTTYYTLDNTKPALETELLTSAGPSVNTLSGTISYRTVSQAGGTGLSGRSAQEFHTVTALDYDYGQQTVIHLRLVARSDEPRPLTSFSTPVPPPVR